MFRVLGLDQEAGSLGEFLLASESVRRQCRSSKDRSGRGESQERMHLFVCMLSNLRVTEANTLNLPTTANHIKAEL